MKLNASLISRWMECPLQTKFAEIEQRPRTQSAKATFGSLIHEALELYNQTGDLAASLDRFRYTWAHPDQFGLMPDTWPKGTTYGSLLKKGEEILNDYHNKNLWEKREIIGAEHRFCVPFGDHLLSGIVDLLEVKRSSRGTPTLRVVDYKTNAKKPTIYTLAMNIQFTTYVYASMQPEFWIGMDEYPGLPNGEELYKRFDHVERKAIWYHLWTNQEINVGKRDDNDFMRLYRCVEEIVKAIEKDVYVPNISGDTCNFCDFTDLCQAVIPIRSKVGQPPEAEETFF